MAVTEKIITLRRIKKTCVLCNDKNNKHRRVFKNELIPGPRTSILYKFFKIHLAIKLDLNFKIATSGPSPRRNSIITVTRNKQKPQVVNIELNTVTESTIIVLVISPGIRFANGIFFRPHFNDKNAVLQIFNLGEFLKY